MTSSWSSLDFSVVRMESDVPAPGSLVWKELRDVGGGGAGGPEGRPPEADEDVAARAYERGRVEGEERGRVRAEERLKPALAALERAAAEVERLRGELRERAEEDLAVLAMAVARRIVDRELREDPEIIRNLLRNALSHFPVEQELRIRINPLDLSVISGAPGEAAPVAGGREVRWIPDESVARGGCVVEGPTRILDGRLETVLDRMYRKVTDG